MGISPSSLALITLENIITLCFRGVIPGDAMAHPDFGRSVNPISTRGYKLCPPNYYWHPRIFRPSEGPVFPWKVL